MGTYSQIYIHVIFSVKDRKSLIDDLWSDDLYKYISGIIRNHNQKLIAINGMPDHIHLLIGLTPTCCLSDLVREIKKSSNKFIKDQRFSKFNFNWQEGFGAFSYSHSALDVVIQYINNQKSHHAKRSFKEEYKSFLEKYHIEFNEQYLK